MAKPGLFFFIFVLSFLNTMTNRYGTKFDYKNVDGALGIRTQDRSGGPSNLNLFLSLLIEPWDQHCKTIFSIMEQS